MATAAAILTLNNFDSKGNDHAKVSVVESLDADTGRFDFGDYVQPDGGDPFADDEVDYPLEEGIVYSVHAPKGGGNFDRYFATVHHGEIVKLDYNAARQRLGTRYGNKITPRKKVTVEEE